MKTASEEYFSGHQKYIKLFASIGVLLLGITFLILTGALRQSSFPIGDGPYYHLAAAGTDEIGIGTGWNFLLQYFPMKYLLIATGLLTILLLGLNFKSFSFEERIVALCIFILSPGFIYFFNVGERFGAAFLFSLLTSCFIFNKKYIFAAVSALIIFLFDVHVGLFVLFMLLLYYLHNLKKRKMLYLLVLASLIFIFSIGGEYGGFISDFGSGIGSSIFSLLFVVFCFFLFWNKKNILQLYGIAFLFFLLSLKFEFGILYFSAVLSLLISLCFFEILKRKWESKTARDLILLIVICGILFSGLSYVNRISLDKPDENIFKALEKLPDNAVVFSDIGYGNWILYSGKRNVWSSMMNRDEIRNIEDDLSFVFEDIDYSETIKMLQRYEVDYILIDGDLREKWHKSGLIYLLRYNNENFKFLFEDDGVEAWRFFR